MIIVRVFGLIIFAIVVVASVVDIWHAIRSVDPHALVTPTHLGMLAIGAFGASLTSEVISDRLLRYLRAMRGLKE